MRRPQSVGDSGVELLALEEGSTGLRDPAAAPLLDHDQLALRPAAEAQLDRALRGIRLWRGDLEGALALLAQEQEAARARQAELVARLAEEDPPAGSQRQQQAWAEIEAQVVLEVMLESLGERLGFVRSAADGLEELEARVCRDKPGKKEVDAEEYQIVEALLEAVQAQGWALYQAQPSSAPYYPGVPTAKPMQQLVRSLIEQTKATAPPPPATPDPRESQAALVASATAALQAARMLDFGEEPAGQGSSHSGEDEPALPQEEAGEGSGAEEAGVLPASGTPSPAQAGPAPLGAAESRGGGGGGPVRAPLAPDSLPASWPALACWTFRSGTRPTPDDCIKRLPRVYALYHELEKGIAADVIRWSSAAPSPVTRGPAQAGPAAAGEAGAGPSPADLAASVLAFRPEAMLDVCQFVAANQVAAQAGGLPPQAAARWSTLTQAAELYERLVAMGLDLAGWTVPAQASTPEEARRLCAYLEEASLEAGRVSYHQSPLRVRMHEQGVPWETAVLEEVRWAAQAAAVALVNHGLEEARALAKSKRGSAHAILSPLANAAVGVFRVHQFAGGLNRGATAAFDALNAVTIHYARMIDPKWFRDTRVVAA